jgi:PH (Pleckstrin Homology) domain-containing protein
MRSERHWSIYLPALTISVLWAGILFWADRHEPQLVTLRFLALVVVGIVVPCLFAWAFLRGRNAEVRITSQNLFVSTGGRRPEKIGADIAFVENTRVAQSFLQRIVDAGRIEICLSGGRRLVLDDMSSPAKIVRAIDAAKKNDERH